MKKYLVFSISVLAILFVACTNSQSNKTTLTAGEFAAKINELPTAVIIDVRTADEFSKGHLGNAVNYDWNGNDFDQQIALLDKSKPVFVYCLSGGRSSAAARKMRADGFKQVYEMEGGMMKWRAANLPESNAISRGMTKPEFEALLSTDKLVLVDFYADWCAPCKKMKPFLDEIAITRADKIVVIRINADNNQSLCKELNIDALPVLQIYKNKVLGWNHAGFIERAEVEKQLQ